MQQRGSVVQSMLAGGVMLGAVPVGLAVIFFSAGSDDGEPRAAMLFSEAGVWAYVVVLATALSSVLAAVAVGLSGKRPALLPLAVIAFAFPALAALVGGELGRAELFEAVTHVSPADQLTIIAAGTGERIGLVQLTCMVLGSAWLLVALAALLTLGDGRPLPRLGIAGAAVLLGLASFALGFNAVQISGIFRAVAMVNPADRALILGAGLLESEPAHRMGLALLAGAVLVTLVASALASRTSAPMTVATLVCCLSGAVALATLHSRARSSAFFVPEGVGGERQTDLFEVTGTYSEGTVAWLEPAESSERIDEAVDEGAVGWRNGEEHVSGLYASKTLTRDQLVRFLQGAQKQELAVKLVGQSPARTMEAPAYARRFLELLDSSQQGVRVEPRTVGTPCERCAGAAKVKAGKLEVTLTGKPPETWTMGDGRRLDEEPPVLDLEWTGGVDELVSAASMAFTHGHVVSVAVPALKE